jgi:hypothetical protein
MKTKGGEFKDIEEALDGSYYLFDQLNERQQFRVAMRFNCGWSCQKLAEYEGVSTEAIWKDLQRVVNLIKRNKINEHIRAVRGVQDFFSKHAVQ